MPRIDQRGNPVRGREQFTTMTRNTMETDAWRALSSMAQALYVWVKLEWKGPKNNNNGKIKLSSRQAAHKMGVNHKTAALGFQELQAKGFLHTTEAASLGFSGSAKSPSFEITELPLPYAKPNVGRCLFREWSPGKDFEVKKAPTHNPHGANGKKTCPKKGNGPVPNLGTKL